MDDSVIRGFQSEDLPRLQQITMDAFESVSIDRNIERKYGVINGVGWKVRKADHIRLDTEREAEGIFVLEFDVKVVGYITCWCNRLAAIGNIPNLALDEEYRGRGFGRRLIEHALDYFQRQGMTHARIETLDQNEVGKSLYPAPISRSTRKVCVTHVSAVTNNTCSWRCCGSQSTADWRVMKTSTMPSGWRSTLSCDTLSVVERHRRIRKPLPPAESDASRLKRSVPKATSRR